MQEFSVTILGARGSVPISGPDFAKYGGATTSVLVQAMGQSIALDAGTGILHLPPEVLARPTLSLILTHAHLDHLNGLSMCPFVMRKDATLNVYASLSGGEAVSAVLNRLYAPPIWPITPDNFAAKLQYHALPATMDLSGIRVKTMDGFHPGGVKLIRLDCGGKSVVFATDCTLTDECYQQTVDFAADCDLLLCDGQYSDDEWPARKGFGHNTWKTAAMLGRDCRARMVRIVHHAPSHKDAQLDTAADEVRAIHPGSSLAFEGEVISL